MRLELSTNQIWDELKEDLRIFIFSKTKDESLTDDLLQDVFLKVHLNLHSIREPEKVKSWVYQITRNQISAFYRTQKYTPVKTNEIEFPEPSEEELADPFCCVNTFLDELPNGYSEVMKLRLIHGKKQAEIARELEISLANVKARIYRSKELLKGKFSNCCGYSINEEGLLVGEQDCQNEACRNQSLNRN